MSNHESIDSSNERIALLNEQTFRFKIGALLTSKYNQSKVHKSDQMKIFIPIHVFLIDFIYFALLPAEKKSKCSFTRLFIIIRDWKNLLFAY